MDISFSDNWVAKFGLLSLPKSIVDAIRFLSPLNWILDSIMESFVLEINSGISDKIFTISSSTILIELSMEIHLCPKSEFTVSEFILGMIKNRMKMEIMFLVKHFKANWRIKNQNEYLLWFWQVFVCSISLSHNKVQEIFPYADILWNSWENHDEFCIMFLFQLVNYWNFS